MEKEHKEESEDVTKYGEFVTSYFAWIPTEKQKDIVQRLEKITIKIKNKFANIFSKKLLTNKKSNSKIQT